MSDESESRVFYYRPAWQKWMGAFIIMAGFTWWHLTVGYGSWAIEEPIGPLNVAYIAMVVLFVGGLGALPAVTLLGLAIRGRLTVPEDGVRWRTWRDEHALSWNEIMAVGEPWEEKGWRRWRHFWFDRYTSMRLLTEDGWRDVQCAGLPEDGDEAFEAIAEAGGLTESFEHDGRAYHHRPGWAPDDLPDSHPWRRVAN